MSSAATTRVGLCVLFRKVFLVLGLAALALGLVAWYVHNNHRQAGDPHILAATEGLLLQGIALSLWIGLASQAMVLLTTILADSKRGDT
jgi:hypothetical protein